MSDAAEAAVRSVRYSLDNGEGLDMDDAAQLLTEHDRMRDALKVRDEILEFFYDDSPCRLDHHGGCQEHGHLEPEPGEVCPQARLKELRGKR